MKRKDIKQNKQITVDFLLKECAKHSQVSCFRGVTIYIPGIEAFFHGTGCNAVVAKHLDCYDWHTNTSKHTYKLHFATITNDKRFGNSEKVITKYDDLDSDTLDKVTAFMQSLKCVRNEKVGCYFYQTMKPII